MIITYQWRLSLIRSDPAILYPIQCIELYIKFNTLFHSQNSKLKCCESIYCVFVLAGTITLSEQYFHIHDPIIVSPTPTVKKHKINGGVVAHSSYRFS